MRTMGAVISARGLQNHDHLCWSYETGDDLREQRTGFLAEGLRLNQRIGYAACADEDQLLADLDGLDGIQELLARGTLHVYPVAERYRVDGPVDPRTQVAAYAAATREAIAAGYSGLRIAADVTALLGSPARHDAFLRYEHLVDRAMLSMPLTAMCCYDRSAMNHDALAELASVHPAAHDADTPFHLFASAIADLALTGEVDSVSADVFGRVLSQLLVGADVEPIVIDCAGLRFIDHHGLLAMETAAGATTIELREGPAIAGRIAELLELDHVVVRP